MKPFIEDINCQKLQFLKTLNVQNLNCETFNFWKLLILKASSFKDFNLWRLNFFKMHQLPKQELMVPSSRPQTQILIHQNHSSLLSAQALAELSPAQPQLVLGFFGWRVRSETIFGASIIFRLKTSFFKLLPISHF